MKAFRNIVWVLLIALMSYLASSDNIFPYLIERKIFAPTLNITVIQEVCLALNIVFTIAVFPIKLGYYGLKNKSYKKQIAGLYNIIKQFAQSNFESISKNKDFDFKMRIFVRERSILSYLKFFGEKRVFFSIRNIEPFASNDVTEDLRFQVFPKAEGLVGKSYSGKGIYYDENLEVTNKTYNLNEAQLTRTFMLKWSICVPIIDARNDVVAVVAFDSQTSRLSIEKNEYRIRELVNPFSQMLYNCAPDLFRPKVVIR